MGKKFCSVRSLTGALAAVVLLSVPGCAQLRDKFIRKPKGEDENIRRYQAVTAYDVKPSLDLYTKRYIFWKSWHKELLEVLSETSHKKKVMAVEQEVSSLMDMYGMLNDAKGDELKPIVDDFAQVEREIKSAKITPGNAVRIRRKLEILGKEVKSKFSYTKIREYIRDEFRKD